MSKMRQFEREYIDLCLRYAKALHVGPRRAFCISGCWSHRCSDRILNRRDIYTGAQHGRRKVIRCTESQRPRHEAGF